MIFLPLRKKLILPQLVINRICLTGLALFVLLLLYMVFITLSQTVTYNSDDASIILEADDVFHGNYFLNGWYLSTESYFTTDIIFYVIAIAVYGFSDKLLFIVPSAIFSLVVIFASIIAGINVHKSFNWRNAFVALLLLVSFSRAYEYFLRGPIHAGPMMYSLACLTILHYEDSHPKLFVGLFTPLLTLALIGDSFVLYFLVIPLLLVQSIEFLQGEKLKLSCYATIASIFLALLLAEVLGTLGMNVLGLDSMRFVNLEKLPDNAALLFKGLSRLYNLYMFGQELKSMTTVRLLVYGLIIIGVLVCVYRSLFSHERIDRVLATACVMVCLEYVASNRPEAIWMPWVPDTARYLVPTFVFSLIIFARNISKLLDNQRKRILLTLLLAFIVLAFGRSFVNVVPQQPPETELIAFLTSKNLATGYGGFWSSNIVTLKSNRQVCLYALKYNETERKIRPYLWLSKKEWYQQPVNFIVLDKRKPLHDGGINYQVVMDNLPPPREIYELTVYTVLVWDKDISGEIAEQNYVDRKVADAPHKE